MSNFIPAAIANSNATIAELQRGIAALRADRKALNRILSPITKAHKAGVLPYLPALGVYGTEYSVHIGTALLDGFRDPRLVTLLSALLDAESTTTKDYPDAMNRDFAFVYRISEQRILRVTICAYVRSDSPTCRKVPKSTKTEVVTTTEYELVCS